MLKNDFTTENEEDSPRRTRRIHHGERGGFTTENTESTEKKREKKRERREIQREREIKGKGAK
jgi:hypothetical protein